jgi:hypothetical protein
MLDHIRRRRVLVAALAGAAFAALGITLASSRAAAGGKPPELLGSSKAAAPLRAGVAYHAAVFPLPLRVTAPEGGWIGNQYRTFSHGRPLFAWVQLTRAGVRGLATIETAYGPTPSVAATIARLRIGGSHLPDEHIGGTTFQEPTPVRVAGYSGQQFDGNVWGIYGRTFVPFTPKTHGASPADHIYVGKDEAFRIIALNVRGKTVVLTLESAELPAEQFPAFLDSASRLLASIRLS